MNTLISDEELKSIFIDFARNSDYKLSVILGAGASFGYSRTDGYIFRPPAVSELLNDANPLVKSVIEKPEHVSVKGQRAHIERSIKGFGGDLEAYLSDIYSNDKADNLFPSMLRYLEDIFTIASKNIDLDDNHYKTLLNRIRDLRGPRPWSILTFNYDTLLEQSIVDLPRFIPGRTFLSDENYINPNPRVLKMHGGVNLRYITLPEPTMADSTSFHDVFTEMMNTQEPINSYLEVKATDSAVPGFRVYRKFKDLPEQITYNFPLMMIPIHTVVRSENSFFARQIEFAKSEISQSKLIIAIGYQFGDNTFMEALSDVNLQESILILVGSRNLIEQTTESRAYKAALKVWPAHNIRIYDREGFGNFVDALY